MSYKITTAATAVIATSFFLTTVSTAFSHAADASTTPQLIKASGHKAVYWVKNGLRSPFPMQSVYTSHFGISFSGVTEITLSALSQYPLGPSVTFKKGSLIKIQTDPKVYEVTDNIGSIQWIKTENDFLSRGFSFKQIQDVPDAFFPDYKIVASDALITTTPPPPPASLPPAQDFTTPTTTASSTPITPVAPVVTELKLQSISILQKKATDSTKASFNFSTTLPARAEIQIGYDGGVTSTVALSATATLFSKEISVLTGSTYNYMISAVTESGLSVSSTGSFMSYADITEKITPNAVVANAPLLKPLTVVGGMTVTNNSPEKRYLNSMTLGFFAATNVTTNVSKNLSVFRSENGVMGDLLMQRNFANGTSILNSQNQQTLTFEDTLAPGESKSYLVTLSNLDNVNLSLLAGTETFETRLIRLESLGDTSVGLAPFPLGLLLHKKPNQ